MRDAYFVVKIQIDIIHVVTYLFPWRKVYFEVSFNSSETLLKCKVHPRGFQMHVKTKP